jgi:hypothetical protein
MTRWRRRSRLAENITVTNHEQTIADCGSRIADCSRAIRNMKYKTRNARRGGVYLAVLGTSLIVVLLALSALALQRIQNRMLTTSADIRQAQLNAEAAIELGLLAMKQDTNWRTTYTNGHWFTNRSLTLGTCSLDGTDPVDSDLADNTTDPVVLTGIGDSGTSEQRVQVTIDPLGQPLSCLRSAIAVGHAVTLSNSVLRASGPVAANSVSASSATIYGNVQGVTVTGSTYSGTSTQVSSSQLPKMPTWSTVFDYYKTNGSQIDPSKLPTQMPNIARNSGVESAIGNNDWFGSPPGVSTATVAQSNAQHRTGSYSLKVSSRADWTAGAAQRIDSYVKPGYSYNISCYVLVPSGALQTFWISLYTKGTAGTVQSVNGAGTTAFLGVWTFLSANLTAPSWSGNLDYAFTKIAGTNVLSNGTFYVDDLTIRENTTGALIYQQALGPGINTLYSGAPTNSRGIYWIDCGLSNRLIIERSRINGTLLVINPGTGSCIGAGPIHWSPAVAGYPALLVHADTASNANFTIQATNRGLSETENGVNYNPTGAPSDDFGQDTNTQDIYPSEIRGLVAVENNLTYQNNGLIRGALVVGNDLTSTSGTLEVAYQPDSLLNPPPGFNSANVYLRRPASAKKTVSP